MAGNVIVYARDTSRAGVAGGGRVTRITLILVALTFLTVFVVLPLANVFTQALSKGWHAYVVTFRPDPAPDLKKLPLKERRQVVKEQEQAKKNWSAIRMTIGVAAIVVPMNAIFGLAAAWTASKFQFRGRSMLVSLIDLPFSVSPVISGLIFVLLFGRQGIWGPWAGTTHWPDFTTLYWRGFTEHIWPLGVREWQTGIIFTPLATVLASIFVTFPFVARSLIPLMQSQGTDAEQAAASLGAKGRTIFWRVTLPSIKWGLLYGVILCTARTLGEFGAVSVVSGHLDTNDTVPLRVEKLWNEYNTQAAFSVASILALLAVVTLVIKTISEWKIERDAKLANASAL